MKTIRKYAETGYDISRLTETEKDDLKREAKVVAAMQRRAAIREALEWRAGWRWLRRTFPRPVWRGEGGRTISTGARHP